MSLERARRIADAVLYEGYVLYPYRASSRKNRYRWTFGVVAPRAWSEAGGCEPWSLGLDCLIDARQAAPIVDGRLRFLQVERREVEAAQPGGGFQPVDRLCAGGEEHITWEEGVERELPFTVTAPGEPARVLEAELEGGCELRPIVEGAKQLGRVRRVRRPLSLSVTAAASRLGSGLVRLVLTVENRTAWDDPSAPREQAVASALVGAHLLLSVSGGDFVSLLDPPAHAAADAAGCASRGLYPVLAGEPGSRDVLLASPIALYDHPQIAGESPGPTFDHTEIDELLALSTRSLTDEEKREARATDPRAAQVIDRAERLSAAGLAALHGAQRGSSAQLGRGSRVRVRLGAQTGSRRTDAQDMFLDGRVGVVEEVREDFDGQIHLAVILEDDPAAELHRWYGRHLHFRPDELELVEQR